MGTIKSKINNRSEEFAANAAQPVCSGKGLDNKAGIAEFQGRKYNGLCGDLHAAGLGYAKDTSINRQVEVLKPVQI